jgi:uncharacterized protein (DUF58 family)
MKWYIGVGLLLLAALALDSGLLAYATYVLLGLLILTRFLARSWINGLSAKRQCNKLTADIDDTVGVLLTIHNKGWMPAPWVLIEDMLPKTALMQRPPRLVVKGKRIQISMIGSRSETTVRYHLQCKTRGYYQLGPVLLESGDLFGLHRRFRIETEPSYLLVYPRVVAMEGYELAARRPIGDVRLTHRLYEDPTRIGGVRPYEQGDPMNRVHWRATARTGALHSKVYEPSTLTGATVLLDFHDVGYHGRGEPFRSELAVTAAASLANAVYELGQQVGLVTNARDAVDRIRLEGWDREARSRIAARESVQMEETSERLQPIVVETRRGVEQLQRIRETLARVELSDGLTCAQLIAEAAWRLPRDATLVALLPNVPVETALALGQLRRQGMAVTVVLVAMDAERLEKGHGRLAAEGIRDVRHLRDETDLPAICRRQVLGQGGLDVELKIEDLPKETPTGNWMQTTTVYGMGDTDLSED